MTQPLTEEEMNRVIKVTEYDLATCLSDEQVETVIGELEKDLLLRPPKGKRFNEYADQVLKEWARNYKRTDRLSIQRLAGWLFDSTLGRLSKTGRAWGLFLDDYQYRYVNAVLASMTAYNRMVLYQHYVTRDKHVSRYVIELNTSKRTYYRHLHDAKYEFIVRGGLQ